MGRAGPRTPEGENQAEESSLTLGRPSGVRRRNKSTRITRRKMEEKERKRKRTGEGGREEERGKGKKRERRKRR